MEVEAAAEEPGAAADAVAAGAPKEGALPARAPKPKPPEDAGADAAGGGATRV